jgi:hypothetical protein
MGIKGNDDRRASAGRQRLEKPGMTAMGTVEISHGDGSTPSDLRESVRPIQDMHCHDSSLWLLCALLGRAARGDAAVTIQQVSHNGDHLRECLKSPEVPLRPAESRVWERFSQEA